MNEFVKALHDGKVVYYIYYNNSEPRFYKLIDNTLHYSDDLVVWYKSNVTDLESVFKEDSNSWSIKG